MSASSSSSSTSSRKRASHPPVAVASSSQEPAAAASDHVAVPAAGNGCGNGNGASPSSLPREGLALKKPLIGEHREAGGFESIVHLKMLIPSVAAGSIIGKGGETIAELQKTTGGRIKMSKAHDFYPGTNERVCLISGSLESVVQILEFITEKIREKPDPHARPAIDFDNKTSAEREKQVKAIVPNSTAGMIIGKGGTFVKQIKDESGAFIQLSQKSKDTALPERVVTVIGEPENNNKAMRMILEKIQTDPQSSSCLNISYGDVTGLVANFNPTGSPFAQGNSAGAPSHGETTQHQQPMDVSGPSSGRGSSAAGANTSLNTSGYSTSSSSGVTSPTSATNPGAAGNGGGLLAAPFVMPAPGGGSLHLRFNTPGMTLPPPDPAFSAAFFGHVGPAIASSGFDKVAAEEITTSLRVLANRGILVISIANDAPTAPQLGPPTTVTVQHQQHGSYVTGAALAPPPPRAPMGPPPPPFGAATGAAADAGAQFSFTRPGWSEAPPPQLRDQQQRDAAAGYSRPFGLVQQQQQQQHLVQQPGSTNQNSFGLGPQTGSSALIGQPPPGVDNAANGTDPVEQIEIEVKESIVGAVIGPSGRSIVNIEQYSGARVQISKKGTYSPGTRNRIVTLSGTAKAIATAKMMIEQKILEEENNRELEKGNNNNNNNNNQSSNGNNGVQQAVIVPAAVSY